MLNKDIDILVVGENYLSYLLASNYISANKTVLILGDINSVGSEPHFTNISMLEYSFIEEWFSNIGIDSFFSYTSSYYYYLNIENIQLHLGSRSYVDNIREVCRKFPEIIDKKFIKNHIEKFDGEVETICHQYFKEMGKSLYQYQSIQNISVDLFLKDAHSFIVDLFNHFKNNINKLLKVKEYAKIDLLIYALRSHFHSVSSGECKEVELFHLFLSLISPCLKINEEKLIPILKEHFNENNGYFRNAKIKDIKYDQGRPWGVELNSFEGVVHPKRVVFVGGSPKDLPVKLMNHDIYIETEALLKGPYKFFKDDHSFHYHPELVGTDFSFLRFYKKDEEMKVSFMTKFKDGLKESFINDEIDRILQKKLRLKDHSTYELTFKKNVCSFKVHGSIGVVSPARFQNKKPGKRSKEILRNIDSLGPLKPTGLGIMSTLLEGKDYHRLNL